MKLAIRRAGNDTAIATEMERGQLIMLGKRIYDMAQDLKNGVILLTFIEPDGLELTALRDMNGHAPAAHFDVTKLGKPLS